MHESAFRTRTTRTASSSVSPATYREAIRRTTPRGTRGSVRTIRSLTRRMDVSSVPVVRIGRVRVRLAAGGPRETPDDDAPRSRAAEAAGALACRRPGGRHVVHQQHAPAARRPGPGTRRRRWRRAASGEARSAGRVSRIFSRRRGAKGIPRSRATDAASASAACSERSLPFRVAGTQATSTAASGVLEAFDEDGGQSRSQVIGSAELECEQDFPGRASVGRAGSEQVELGRVQKAPAATERSRGLQLLVADVAASRRQRGQTGPAGRADTPAQDADPGERSTSQASRREDDSRDGAERAEPFPTRDDSRVVSSPGGAPRPFAAITRSSAHSSGDLAVLRAPGAVTEPSAVLSSEVCLSVATRRKILRAPAHSLALAASLVLCSPDHKLRILLDRRLGMEVGVATRRWVLLLALGAAALASPASRSGVGSRRLRRNRQRRRGPVPPRRLRPQRRALLGRLPAGRQRPSCAPRADRSRSRETERARARSGRELSDRPARPRDPDRLLHHRRLVRVPRRALHVGPLRRHRRLQGQSRPGSRLDRQLPRSP